MPVYRIIVKYDLEIEADDEDYACERVWTDYDLPDYGRIEEVWETSSGDEDE